MRGRGGRGEEAFDEADLLSFLLKLVDHAAQGHVELRRVELEGQRERARQGRRVCTRCQKRRAVDVALETCTRKHKCPVVPRDTTSRFRYTEDHNTHRPYT